MALFREQTGLPEKSIIPSILLMDVFAEIEHHMRSGIDRI